MDALIVILRPSENLSPEPLPLGLRLRSFLHAFLELEHEGQRSNFDDAIRQFDLHLRPSKRSTSPASLFNVIRTTGTTSLT
ncbi:hypothetical protein ACWGPT_18485 [Pseudorhizobium sp. NPDC055634]